MKPITCLFPVILLLSACRGGQKERLLQEKETRLQQKEQELILREKTLDIKEQEWLRRQQQDTATLDTLQHIDPSLAGNWTVKMTCTETTCAGSAVGDTKTEQWQLSYQDKNIIARAMSNDALVRVYTGIYTGNTVELVSAGSEGTPASKMVVRLRRVNETTLEGEREIVRENQCKIVYALKLDKE